MTDRTLLVLMFAVNLITIIGGVGKGITLLISVRDEIKDLVRNVGTNTPPMGLLGDVAGLQKEYRSLHDWSIDAAAQLDIRRPGGRS